MDFQRGWRIFLSGKVRLLFVSWPPGAASALGGYPQQQRFSTEVEWCIPSHLKGSVGGHNAENAVITSSVNSSQIALTFGEPLHQQQGNSFPPLLLQSPARRCSCTWSAQENNRNSFWNFRAEQPPVQTVTSYCFCLFPKIYVSTIFRDASTISQRKVNFTDSKRLEGVLELCQFIVSTYQRSHFIISPMYPKERVAHTSKNTFPLIQIQAKAFEVCLCVISQHFCRPRFHRWQTSSHIKSSLRIKPVWMCLGQHAGIKVISKWSQTCFSSAAFKGTRSLFCSFNVKLSKVPLIQMQIKWC